MSRLARSLIARKGETAVWRARVEGVRSSVTGHPAITWLSGLCFDCDCFDPDCFLCDYNIEIIRAHVSTRPETIAGTRMTRKVVNFFTWAPLRKGDQVDYHGDTFEVESVEYRLWLNGERSFNKTTMVEDDDVTNANDLHLYERGPEDIKNLFYTDGFDVVFFYGEPRVRSARENQDIPIHFLMTYPVTVMTIDKHDPVLGPLVCTATTMQAKARDTLRLAIAGSAQSATPAYTLTIRTEDGKNDWRGGINIWTTPYYIEYMTG